MELSSVLLAAGGRWRRRCYENMRGLCLKTLQEASYTNRPFMALSCSKTGPFTSAWLRHDRAARLRKVSVLAAGEAEQQQHGRAPRPTAAAPPASGHGGDGSGGSFPTLTTLRSHERQQQRFASIGCSRLTPQRFSLCPRAARRRRGAGDRGSATTAPISAPFLAPRGRSSERRPPQGTAVAPTWWDRQPRCHTVPARSAFVTIAAQSSALRGNRCPRAPGADSKVRAGAGTRLPNNLKSGRRGDPQPCR